MLGDADRGPGAVEDDELRLEEDVAVDGERETLAGLQAAETDCIFRSRQLVHHVLESLRVEEI